MEISRHWVARVAGEVERYWSGSRGLLVCSGGLSVSGLQHVGRLRGEIILVESVRRILEDRGWETRHILVLYTQDSWKGKEAQIRQFKDVEEAEGYRGWRLVDVPDPYGCCRNWVEHYWKDFGSYLESFSEPIEVYTTTELYRSRAMRTVVQELLDKRRLAVEVINRFRGRKPFPSSWIPFEPLCRSCNRIDSAEPLSVDFRSYRVRYRCRFCGYEGESSMEDGKLYWRLEWPALWKILRVGFEPYGKDHATPGGSRDSCVEVAEKILGVKPPYGIPYEWVGYSVGGRDLGDMGSSDFIGFTPRDWIQVAEPEALRYYFLVNEPMRRLTLSLDHVYRYVDLYDQAERVYFGKEPSNHGDQSLIRESYLLANKFNPPPRLPFQLPYLHAALLVQVLPEDGRVEAALRRLKSTGMVKRELEPWEVDRVKARLRYAENWLRLYAPEAYRVKILEELTPEIAGSLTEDQKAMLRDLARILCSCRWTEDSIKEAMKAYTSRLGRGRQRKLFEALYMVMFGRPFGPRIAPYLALLERRWVLGRIKEASSLER